MITDDELKNVERMIDEIKYLKEFKERVLPHLSKYITLMHLVGNHSEISGL